MKNLALEIRKEPSLRWFLAASLVIHFLILLLAPNHHLKTKGPPPLSLELVSSTESQAAPPQAPRVPQTALPRPLEPEVYHPRLLSKPQRHALSWATPREVLLPESKNLAPFSSEAPEVPFLPKPWEGRSPGDSLDHYLSQIRKLIEEAKHYPLRARLAGYEGEVTIFFEVGLSGEIKEIKLLRPSSFAVLNQAAIKTIKKVSPLPPPPKELHPPLKLSIKLSYRLTS